MIRLMKSMKQDIFLNTIRIVLEIRLSTNSSNDDRDSLIYFFRKIESVSSNREPYNLRLCFIRKDNKFFNELVIFKTTYRQQVGICHWLFRTARIFWLKRTVKWSAVRAAPGTAGGLPPGVTVFANARIK